MTSVNGKNALVTGGGSGINLAFTKALIAKGCNVLIADLKLLPEAEQLVSETSGGNGAKAVFQKCDVTNWADLSAAMAACEKEFGGIDIVCPGAGVFEPPFSNFWIPPGSGESRDKVDSNHYISLDINITHPIRLTQLAIAHFISKKKPGNVVNIASIAGQIAVLTVPMYVAAKWAVSGFVRSLAPMEEKYGIRVNCVAPGVVKTPIWLDSPDKMRMLDESLDVWVTPEEVADAMVALVEDKQYEGGTVLEIGAKQLRVVPQFNNPGPSGQGNSASKTLETFEEIYTKLGQEPWTMGL